MYRLPDPAADDGWQDFAAAGVPGVRVRFAPISRLAWRAAKRAARKAMLELGPVTDGETLSEAQQDAASDAMSRVLVERSILEWEGLGDAKGKATPPTPGTIAQFIADARLMDAADQLFVTPYLLKDAEKNGLSPSPNGSSATRAKRTAPGAQSRSAAKPARSASTKSKTKRSASPGT